MGYLPAKVSPRNRVLVAITYVQASYLAHSVGNPYLWERPEDLGKAADDLIPATIWQWAEILDLLLATGAQSFAFYQCQFDAPYPKPTRILTTLSHFVKHKQPYSGMPAFSQTGAYMGPLPAQCSHGGNHDPLIGKDPTTGAWKTAPSASYPPNMCRWLAEAIIASFHDLDLALHAKGGDGLDPDVKTAATQGPALPPFPTSGLVPDSKVPSSRSSALVPAPKATAGRNAVPTQPTAHPFPPPFPSSGLDSAPGVLATVPQSGQTPRQALGTHSSTPLSGLDSIGFRVPAVFSQPASHPSSGLGPNAPKVSSERPSRAHQGTTAGEAHAQVSDAPEVLAEELLKRPSCTRAEVERLFDMLPQEVPPRREEGEAEGSSFSTGCYSKGGITGLRHNTTAFPMATKLLARFARSSSPRTSRPCPCSMENQCIGIHAMARAPMGSAR